MEKEDYSRWTLRDRLELLAFEARLAMIPRPLIAALWEVVDQVSQELRFGFDAALRKVYPDSVARKKLNDRFNWIFQGVPHVDNIYRKIE